MGISEVSEVVQIENRTTHLFPAGKKGIPLLAGRLIKGDMQVIFSIHLSRAQKGTIQAEVTIIKGVTYRETYKLSGEPASWVLAAGMELIHSKPGKNGANHYFQTIGRVAENNWEYADINGTISKR
jgi:hypothetical protein